MGRFIRGVIVVVSLIAVLIAFASEKTEAPKREKTPEEAIEDLIFTANVYAVKRIRDSLKNPDSFDLVQAIRLPDGTLCLTYRATNSFNAILTGRAVVTDKGTFTSDAGSGFANRWNRTCADKPGKDVKHIRTGLKFIQ